MNGFQREIRSKIIGVSAHMQILSADNSIPNWQQIGEMSLQDKNILAYAPYIDGQGLISFDGSVGGVLIRGVDASYEPKVDDIAKSISQGSFASLESSTFNTVIGKDLARQLGVGIGDKITIITPDGQITPGEWFPDLSNLQSQESLILIWQNMMVRSLISA